MDSPRDAITGSPGLLRRAAALISEADADAPTPCSAWTVTQVLQHALARHIVENPMLNGETIRLDGAISMSPRL